MAETKISLKLLIDKKRNRVLFAEAGKDFVDFLLETFTLPVVTVTRFLKNEDTAGCLQSLYDSVVNLSDTFIQQGVRKDLVLKPRVVTSGATDSLLLPRIESYTFRKFYRCRNSNCMSNYGVYKSTRTEKHCYVCNLLPNQMHEEPLSVEEVISENKESGNFSFMKEIVPYMVMDDLRMKPMSANSFITLLNEYNLKDVGVIEEKVVALGMDEKNRWKNQRVEEQYRNLGIHKKPIHPPLVYGPPVLIFIHVCNPTCVKLIKAALQSKTVLTDVFLPRSFETVESIKTSETS